MGKKSKKSGGSGRAPSSSSVTVPAWTAPDAAGRMEERHGRRLYALLDVLSLIVVPRVNAVLPPQKKIDWDPQGATCNSIPTRTVVYDYLLENVEEVTTEINQGKHDRLIRSVLGRRLMQQDLKDLDGLKCHIEDDFFVLKHIPNQGTVFCQVGKVNKQKTDMLEYEGDNHEVRVFVVQGLADSLQNLCRGPNQIFQQKYPRIAEKYAEEFPDLCEIHTTLIPYNGYITYHSVVNFPTQRHHTTPQESSSAVRAAVEAYRAAFAESPGPNAPTVYKSLDPEADKHLCRLGKSQQNLMTRPLKHSMSAGMETDTDEIEILVRQIAWSPFNSSNDQQVYDDVVNNVRPRPPHEGAKNEVGFTELCNRDEVCPFHRSLGEGRKFADCCLESYKQRSRKGPPHVALDPLEDHEAEHFYEYAATIGRSLSTRDFSRLGYMIFCDSTLHIDPLKSSALKTLMDDCPLFHNILEHKWLFLGQHKIKYTNLAVYCFGDVELDPTKGRVMISTSTEGRLKALSYIVKDILRHLDINVMGADIKVTPVEGNKPPPSLVDKMRKILVEGLENVPESDVSTSIEKTAVCGKQCGYCGLQEEEKLKRCACKKAWYCSVSHQKKHWPDHRKECSAAKK